MKRAVDDYLEDCCLMMRFKIICHDIYLIYLLSLFTLFNLHCFISHKHLLARWRGAQPASAAFYAPATSHFAAGETYIVSARQRRNFRLYLNFLSPVYRKLNILMHSYQCLQISRHLTYATHTINTYSLWKVIYRSGKSFISGEWILLLFYWMMLAFIKYTYL